MELELVDYAASGNNGDDEGIASLKPPRRSFDKFASMCRRRSLEESKEYVLEERLYGERQACSFKISDNRGPLFSIDCSELGDDPGISILSSAAGPRMLILRLSTADLWNVPDTGRDSVSLNIYLGSGALHGKISKQDTGDYQMRCGEEVLTLSGDFQSHEIRINDATGSAVAVAGSILGTRKYEVKVERGADAGLILLALLAIDKCELRRQKNTRWEFLNQMMQVALGIANLVIATGILTVPYGFVLSGWGCVVFLPLSTCVVGFTAVLLGSVLEELRNRGVAKPGYGDIGRFGFGRIFAPVFVFTSCGECFFMVVFYVVFMSNCLSTAFQTSAQPWAWVSVFFIVLAKLIPKRYVVLIDATGTALTVFSCVAAMYTGLRYERVETSQSAFGIGGFQGVLTVLGMVAICSADHPCFTDIYNRSNDNQAYKSGVILGFSAFAVSALSLGVITYATMGEAIDQLVLTNIGRDAKHENFSGVPVWVGPAANFLLAVKSAFICVSWQKPVLAALHDVSWRLAIDLYAPDDLESEVYLIRDSPRKFCGRMILILGTLLLCTFLAVQFEEILDALEALTSSLFKSLNAIIVPCWAYYTLCGSQLQDSPKLRVLLISLTAFGFVWLLLGSISTVIDMANRIGQSNEETE